MAEDNILSGDPGEWSTPLHLLKPDENLRLQAVPETLDALTAIKGPVVLVTVVGTQRGGKSTLLNLLHSRRTSGFGVGHFLDAMTTGLWIWTRKHPRNPEVTIILMDTEGLDSPHIPNWYNWTLSAVALLIATYFVYQTKGHIDAHSIERLSVILQVAEQLKGDKADTSTDLPNFLWLIRDHQLKMTAAPKEEMMAKLTDKQKEALDRCFAASDCFPLPRPVDKESDLQNVEQMPYNELKEDFKEEYLVLERQIFTAVANPRKLNGRIITGETLAKLVSLYTTAIAKTDGVISDLSGLPTQWEMVAKMSGERANKAAFAKYQEAIAITSKNMPLTQEAIGAAHDAAAKEAFALFCKEAKLQDINRPSPELVPYLENLRESIAKWAERPTVRNQQAIVEKVLLGGAYHELWQRNASVSRDKLLAATQRLQAKIDDDETAKKDQASLTLAQSNAVQQFDDDVTLRGLVGREEVREEWLKQHQQARAVAAIRETRDAAAKAAAEARDMAEQVQGALNTHVETLSAKIESLRDEANQKLQGVEQAQREAQTSLKALADERHANTNRRLDTIDDQVNKINENAANVQPKLDTLKEQLMEQSASNAAARADMEQNLRNAIDSELQQTGAAVKGLTERCNELHTEINTLQAAFKEQTTAQALRLSSLSNDIEEQATKTSSSILAPLEDLKKQHEQALLRIAELETSLAAQQSLSAKVDQLMEQTPARADDVERRLREANEANVMARQQLEQQLKDAEKRAEDAQKAADSATQTANKLKEDFANAKRQSEEQRAAVDALWESLGQMASRIVGVESAVDETRAVSSSKSMIEPKNKQKAQHWLDSVKDRLLSPSAAPADAANNTASNSDAKPAPAQ